MGAVAAIGGALKGASKVAGAAKGLFGGGGGGGGDGGMAQYQAQVEQAKLANAERQKISDGYFGQLLDGTYGNPEDLLFDLGAENIFGKRPEYYEVDFEGLNSLDPGLGGIAGDVTQGNIDNFGDNSRLSSAINQFLTNDSKNRINAFDPYLADNIEQTGKTAALAGQGILPGSDIETITGQRNESTGIFGTAGTSRGQVAKDLGLAQFDLQTRVAPGLNQANTQIINSILPPELRDDPRSGQVQASQAIGIAAADNQYEAQFDRAEQNLKSLLESIPDPQAQGLFNLQNSLRSQQFTIDFGLANGEGVPNTMPDNLGSKNGGGSSSFGPAMQAAGGMFQTLGGVLGGGFRTPGIFG